MTYVKGVLFGIGAVLLGCLVAPIALVIWGSWKSPEGGAVSFTPMGLASHLAGLASHLAHSSGFWAFILVLFAAGCVPPVLFPKR